MPSPTVKGNCPPEITGSPIVRMGSAAAVAKSRCHKTPAATAPDNTRRRELPNLGRNSPPWSPIVRTSEPAWSLNSMEKLERESGMWQ
mmetsp:Transcript_95285/g.188848  ORF Transcript_95285/g.188848 Transcript_95285/m.188848 type:complete len:88 (-) Transcript_95285:481-744(-)